jgi:shikimate kinase
MRPKKEEILRFGKSGPNPLSAQLPLFLMPPPKPEPNLYIVGFMGTGKTTIGRVVAFRLQYQLFDSDQEIERDEDRSIPDIFANEGEAQFRRLERRFIEVGHPNSRCVVACGGGLVVQPGMLDFLRVKGVVICLHASLETVLERTSNNQNRPLLNVADPRDRIATLYAEREPIYKRAGAVILTDRRPASDIISHVLRTYRREASDWAKRKH